MIRLIKFFFLDRYIIREVLRPLAAICSLFILMFGGYSTAKILSEAVAGLLPVDIVSQLIALKVVIALEVLLPIGLYLSVVMGLGRLHTDSEVVAMAACGYSEGRILWSVLRLGLFVALIVGFFSMMLRPLAYEKSYILKNRAEAQFDINKLEAGRFYASESSDYVIFAEAVDRKQQRLEKVFFSRGLKSDEKVKTIYAQSLFQEEKKANGDTLLKFEDGYAYELAPRGSDDFVLKFKHLTLTLAGAPEPTGYKSKAAAMRQLWGSGNPKDIAELQWRLLRPVSTVILAMLAVPLSRTKPRQGRYGKTILAIVLFAVYYNLSGMAKTWVKEGVIGPIPGVWWPDCLLVAILCFFYWPVWRSWWRARRLKPAPGY